MNRGADYTTSPAGTSGGPEDRWPPPASG